MMKRILFIGILLAGGIPFFVSAATLSVSPSAGSFVVGSTFDVGVFLDTTGESINALDVALSFPPDKLQIVSPAASPSIISVWTGQPKFNNANGRIQLQGGIPGGINVSNGLITKITFRVKGVGSGIIRFLDNSKVLLNDGLGTDVLKQTQNGAYVFILPPPAGPVVVSETHPNQSYWYSNPTVVLSWAVGESNVQGYSYILSDNPIDSPDNILENTKTAIVYKNLSDGIHYFHIKSLRDGFWGGVTHYALNIDTTPPADFSLDVIPSFRTTRRQPIIQFFTTDAKSGLDHYEFKIIPLMLESSTAMLAGQELFIEAQNPYIPPPLELGTYDVILRAYDKAGNYREVTERLKIVNFAFQFIGEKGLELKSNVVISWLWFWGVVGLLLILLSYFGWHIRRWHYQIHIKHVNKELPGNIQQQLTELKQYRSKYGKIIVLLLLIISPIFFAERGLAQQIELTPPLITTISRNISNEEIFYVGGKTDAANSMVIIYLQNLQSGETLSQSVTSDKYGEWFYRHDTFLSTGNYLLWSQSKLTDQLSPPSPQVQLTVRPTAIQFGASRLSYETLYLTFVILLLLVVLGLIFFIVFHTYHGTKKRRLLEKEIREAEESIRRGFAVLRRDVQAELATIKKAKLSKQLSDEEKQKEAELLKDLEWAEQYISKEIWDVEHGL
ncbi:hypothetical protein HY967_03305 [Candidatus Jorgensenbacteria bacterium]|nr:hypothetical protein [Candidatus Jorgensenbacteria bacterium]